jgi:acetyltransferase
MAKHYLSKMFEPSSVALFGASERPEAVGTLLFKNLLEGGFKGELHPINPGRESVQGRPAFPSLEALARPIDLAIVTTPAPTVPGIIEACGEHGVRNVIIISAGFRETGAEGLMLERAVLENAHRYGVRFLGPNCLGIIRPRIGLNATFAKGTALNGRIALVSQSGALCTAILDWATANGIGFSNVISTGIGADLDFGEILDYLVNDPETESILLYIEGIHNARSFMSGIRMAARVKPVIALKVGRHAAGERAAKSHSGALVGADDVFDAALHRAGVVRGMRIGNLFAAATTLISRFRVEGDRLAIITNGGGPGVMATDKAADLGIPLAELSEESLRLLDEILPRTWSHGNPMDIIGDAGPDRYAGSLEIVLRDGGVDGTLLILTPQAMTRPLDAARSVIEVSRVTGKPILTCWMGEIQVKESRALLSEAGIPSFNTPEAAVEAFSYLTTHYKNQILLLETPGPISQSRPPDVDGAVMIIQGALSEGRKVLSETESKAILSAFRIPSARATVVRSAGEALVQAESIGLPVAMKINSPDITHKSDAGGVRLGINTPQGVRSAYNDLIATVRRNRPDARMDGVTIEPMLQRSNGRELLVGLITDPVFGPVITFGSGGTSVEVMGDRAVSLPPLNSRLARELISRTRVARLLGPFRNMPPADSEALEEVLMRVSEMACELPWIKELDINPLIVDETGAIAADARIIVDYHTLGKERYDHMAIHPYPSHRVIQWQIPDGTNVTIRPIRPEDAQIEQAFVKGLSDQAKYFRFMQAIDELTPSMLARFTQIDYDREMAYIAVVSENGSEVEIGVSRYITNPDGESCEFAIVIADAWQRRGIAHRLMEALIETARGRGLHLIEGDVLADNHEMLGLMNSLGFEIVPHSETPTMKRVAKRLL